MDTGLPELSDGFPQSPDRSISAPNQMETNCFLCRRNFFLDSEINEEFESICICGECKVLFLENFDSDVRDSRPSSSRRQRRSRTSRYNRSSESIEDLFSQQFSQLINLVRRNQDAFSVTASELEPQANDSALTVLPTSSSRTTPSRSGRWRRVLSDNESEGLGGNLDSSLFGETDSSFSYYGGYGALPGDSDTLSFSAYGGESDASVDGHNFLEEDFFIHRDVDERNIDSGTDIDPMNAGQVLEQWDSDIQDEEEGEWEEEVDMENEAETSGWTHGSEISERNGSRRHINWQVEVTSPGYGSRTPWRIEESQHTYIRNIFTNLDESALPTYIGNPGDYLDARGFEQLLEQLADIDYSRRGAPPASTSVVKDLRRVVISEEHTKHGCLLCAVCKDPLTTDSEATQLPCSHLYHPSCISPWLNTRNSCPVCRYELPTDDRDYEEGKRSLVHGTAMHEIHPEDLMEDSPSEITDGFDVDGSLEEVTQPLGLNATSRSSATSAGRRGGWLFVAAAPIVSIVGLVLVFWFRNPLAEHRMRCRQRAQTNLTRGNRNRRWWFLF